MAVLGSNGAGWKVSSFTKSLFCGDCGTASLDLRPVNVSQLEINVSKSGMARMHEPKGSTYIAMLKRSGCDGGKEKADDCA